MTAGPTSDVEDGLDRPVEQALVLGGGRPQPTLPVTGNDPAPCIAQAERSERRRPDYHEVGQPIFAVPR